MNLSLLVVKLYVKKELSFVLKILEKNYIMGVL